MNKRGQGISINTIIIAALALVVLVVLFAVFTGRFKLFSEGVSQTTSCENTCKGIGMHKSGYAADGQACANMQGTYMPGTYSDVGIGVCCCSRTAPGPQQAGP